MPRVVVVVAAALIVTVAALEVEMSRVVLPL